MNTTAAIEAEMQYIESTDFELGKYIYMGMGKLGSHTVVLSVAYKIDYCLRKAEEFVSACHDERLRFTHVNKVLVGELEACERFDL